MLFYAYVNQVCVSYVRRYAQFKSLYYITDTRSHEDET